MGTANFNDFQKTNRELIELIRESDHRDALIYLEELFNYYIETPLKGEFTQDEMLFLYAEIQMKLSKCLDFLLPSSYKNNTRITSTLHSLVISSINLYESQVKQCNPNYEDGACLIGHINYNCPKKNGYKKKWPPLNIVDAICFFGKVKPCELKPGDSIFRICQNDAQAIGNWWLREKPNDRKKWRSSSAVSEQWNRGTQCATLTLEEVIRVWEGKSSLQAVPKSPNRCYLPGGGMQIWLDISKHTNLQPEIEPWPSSP